jgi:hypothetical protein
MEVRRMDEDTLRVGFSWQPLAAALLGLDYVRSDRDGSGYDGNAPFRVGHVAGTVDPDDPLDFENHPLLRKYFLTDRVRNEARNPRRSVSIARARLRCRQPTLPSQLGYCICAPLALRPVALEEEFATEYG